MFPAHAVLDYAVQSACHEKLATVNFGSSGGIASLEQFKSFWGANPEPCWHFRWKNPVWDFVTRINRRISTND